MAEVSREWLESRVVGDEVAFGSVLVGTQFLRVVGTAKVVHVSQTFLRVDAYPWEPHLVDIQRRTGKSILNPRLDYALAIGPMKEKP